MANTIRLEHRVDGVLTNATTVTLSDSAAAYGIRNKSNAAVVVAAGTAVTNAATGVYTYDVSALDKTVTYEGYWKVVTAQGTEYVSFDIEAETSTVTFRYLKDRVLAEMRDFGANMPEQYAADAVNDAIRDAWPSFYVKAQYNSVVTTTAELDYLLPTACARVFKIELLPSESSAPPDVLRRYDVDLRSTGNYLRITEPKDAGRAFRVYAAEKHTELTGDTDTTSLEPQFIVAYARARLHEIRSAYGNGEFDQAAELAQAQYWWKRAQDLKRRASNPAPSQTPVRGNWH